MSEWRVPPDDEAPRGTASGLVPPMVQGDLSLSRGDARLRIVSLIALTVIVVGVLYRVIQVFSTVQQQVDQRLQPTPVHRSVERSRAEESR